MNSLPLQCPGEGQQYARSLALSLLLHGLAVGAAVTLLGDLKMAPQPEPFRWEVSMVEPIRPKPEPQPTPSQTPPAHPTSAPVEKRRADPQPVLRTVQVQTVQMAQPVQQVVRQEVHHRVREVQPLVEATAPSTSTVTRTIQAVEATHQTAIETIQSAGYHALVHETAMTQHVTEEGRSVPSSASSVLSRSIVEAAPAAVVSQPMVTEVKPAATVAARPAVEAMQAPVSVQEQIAVRENATQPASPVIQEASVREIQARPAPAAKADYGWLAQALWDRVARLKHYPHMARVNHLEGRVVVRAIIKEDGHLAEVGVAESSGHPVLDQDALEVIRRACPLKLRHPLGWPQVVVQVPINYRLEN